MEENPEESTAFPGSQDLPAVVAAVRCGCWRRGQPVGLLQEA